MKKQSPIQKKLIKILEKEDFEKLVHYHDPKAGAVGIRKIVIPLQHFLLSRGRGYFLKIEKVAGKALNKGLQSRQKQYL